MSLFEAAWLGVIQGLTEFLPVSSSAHLILMREAFGWDAGVLNIPFDVACHVGTLLAVVWFFRADLIAMVRAVPGVFAPNPTPDARRIWLVVAATIPIVIVGLSLTDDALDAIRAPWVAGVALVVGAGLLFLVERLGPRSGSEATLTLVGAALIGVAQAMALVPGVSRSGATITAGMLLGLNRLAAARFAFVMSVPAITAAALKEGLELRHVSLTAHDVQVFAVGLTVSAAVGYLAVSFLLRYLVSNRLDVFAWYRIALAVAIFGWLLPRG